MKFRLFELWLLVLIVACTMVGLRYVHPLMQTAFYSLTLLGALVTILMAVGRSTDKRAFWVGFSIALNSYLVFVHIGDNDGIVPRHNGPEISTQLLRLGFNWLHGASYEAGDFDTGMGGFFSVNDERGNDFTTETEWEYPGGKDGDVVPFPTNLSIIVGGGQTVHEQPLIADYKSIAFMRIGHCFCAIVLGWLGGHFTQMVYRNSRRISES